MARSIAVRVKKAVRIVKAVAPSASGVRAAGGAEQGLKQSAVGDVPFKEKFRVPLDPEEESVAGGFDRLDDAIRSDRARDQRRGDGFHGLMMRAIHPQGGFGDDLSEKASGGDVD